MSKKQKKDREKGPKVEALMKKITSRGEGEGRGSSITTLVLSIFVALIVAFVSFRAAWQKRKAAKLAAELRKLKLQKEHEAYKAIMAEEETKKAKSRARLEELEKDISSRELRLKKLEERHQKLVKELDSISSWDQVTIK